MKSPDGLSAASPRNALLEGIAGLSEAGYFIGRNVTIEVFRANGRYDRLPALADEMVPR